jgi:hypothetical protein
MAGFSALVLALAENPRSGIGQIREVLSYDWTAGEPLTKADAPKFPAATAGGLGDADSGRQILDSSSQEGRTYPPIVRPRQLQSKMSDCKSAGLCLQWFESTPAHNFREAKSRDISVDENVFDYPREVLCCGRSQNVERAEGGIIHSCPKPLNMHKHKLHGPVTLSR